MQQAVLIASSTESAVTAWDLSTGTQLTQYKANASPRNGLCLCGRGYIAAAQSTKDSLHFWAWHKDQVLQRSFAQERLTALAATLDGAYLAAGGASGTIYVWELGSGRLLRTWPAHYKAVSVLCFTEGGGLLLSGSEDTLVAAWQLGDILDVASAWDPHARVEPLHSWSDHSLPVTSICVGVGEVNAVVATASLDRSVKLWSIATGTLLRTVALPAAATAVAFDSGEHALYAGCSDGRIFEASLLGQEPPSLVSGAGGLHAGLAVLEGHTGAVASLAASLDGESLVSGSDDGTVRVWDLRSRQATRVLSAPGKAPVSAALVVQWPAYLQGMGQAAAGSAGRAGPARAQPLAPLSKFPNTPGILKPWEGAPVVLDGGCPIQGISALSGLLQGSLGGSSGADAAAAAAALVPGMGQQAGVPPPFGVAFASGQGVAAGSAVAGGAATAAGAAAAPDAAALQEQVAQLQDQLRTAQQSAGEWQRLHSELHEFCMQQVLAQP